MKKAILTLALAGALGAYVAGPGMAQAPAAKAPVAKAPAAKPSVARAPAVRAGVPRVAGKPDFSGVWQVLNTANWDIEPHAARPALAMRDGPVVPVPAKPVVALGAVGSVPAGMGVVEGGQVPYKPDARAKKNQNQANWLDSDPEIKCYLPGVPRANYMGLPFQILQSDRSMMFAYEYAGAVRNIFLKDPGPAPVDSWMGQSYGKWEGDTLVITVTGQNGRSWLDRSGNHYSASAVVTERYKYTDADHIQYDVEISDPDTYIKPLKMSMVLYRRIGPDARLQQFKCVEFVEELIYGHLRKEPLK